MTLLMLAYFGGILTIISPCILPVVPFVFSQAHRSFRKEGLPLLAGMAIAFAGVGTIAAMSGAWAMRANAYGRVISLVIFGIFGLTLVAPALAERFSRPMVRLGARLSQSAAGHSNARQPFELGLATGLLWAPCAGPILGLVLTQAALEGASLHSALLLLAYGLGGATSLALVLLAGSRVLKALKRSYAAEDWIRRAVGAAVLVGVAAAALGVDRGVLTRLALADASPIERRLVDRFHLQRTAFAPDAALITHAPMAGAVAWLNSPPLTVDALKGKVVIVDFWAYSCINCLRTLPYLRAWADKYQSSGLVVIGVHTPEYGFERDLDNVRNAVRELGITYPVAVDNNYAIWREFNNAAWPGSYFIDAAGHIRYRQLGEGEYRESEQIVQTLLRERNGAAAPAGFVQAEGEGGEAASDGRDVRSPETSITEARNFPAANALGDGSKLYALPADLSLNRWGLAGQWQMLGEKAVLAGDNGKIAFRFHARDLHLVLGIQDRAQPVRFRVTLDGAAPGADHGADIDPQGYGTLNGHRLYQLIRERRPVRDRTFEIEFSGPGVQAFSFSFG